MEVMNKPQLTKLVTGETFKILKVEGLAGMVMPPHHSTKEAALVVEQGEALLKMPDSEYPLQKGSVFIVPAGKEHTLTIKKDFRAVAVMAIDSEINFI